MRQQVVSILVTILISISFSLTASTKSSTSIIPEADQEVLIIVVRSNGMEDQLTNSNPCIVNKKLPKNYTWKNWPFYPPVNPTVVPWPFPKYTY